MGGGYLEGKRKTVEAPARTGDESSGGAVHRERPSHRSGPLEEQPYGIGGRHEGPSAMRRSGWGAIARHFAARAEPERFLDVGESCLLVTGRYRGEGKHGGAALDASFAHLITFEGERITKRRHELVAAGDEYRNLCFVKSGYAVRYKLLRNGKRQILNVILPGDVIGFPVSFFASPVVTLGASGPTGAFPLVISRSTIGFNLSVNTGPVDVMWIAVGTKA